MTMTRCPCGLHVCTRIAVPEPATIGIGTKFGPWPDPPPPRHGVEALRQEAAALRDIASVIRRFAVEPTPTPQLCPHGATFGQSCEPCGRWVS